MKKVVCLLLSLVFILSFCACNGTEQSEPVTKQQFTQYITGNLTENDITAQVDEKANALLDTIIGLDDTVCAKPGCSTYYLSNNGDDTNSGTSPDEPIATVDKLNSLDLSYGDCVLFNRGDTFRSANVKMTTGVSYGAYGTGDKPKLYGSPQNFKDAKWLNSNIPNVYILRYRFTGDVGAIIFNDAEEIANKVDSMDKLKENIQFYFDSATCLTYVYCDKGCPADVYDSIEVNTAGHIFSMKSGNKCTDITIENICLMYTGYHGIGVGAATNLNIRGCIVGYIGGSIQPGMLPSGTRFGNGIEVWGACDGYYIDHCYVYQCYDSGITMQYGGEEDIPVYEKNIKFTNNLLEYSHSNIEYWMNNKSDDSAIQNVEISGNICRKSGYGWSYNTRPSRNNGCLIVGGLKGIQKNRTENFVVSDNIFDRARAYLFHLGADKDEWIPQFINNTYILHSDSRFINYQDKNYGSGKSDEAAKLIKDTNPTIYIV